MRKRAIAYGIVALFSLIALFPVAFTFVNSFLSQNEAMSRYSTTSNLYNVYDAVGKNHYASPTLLPDYPTLGQYVQVLTGTNLYLGLFWNSVFIMVPVVLGTLFIALPAAYAFTFMRWQHKEKLYFLYIIVMLMPMQITLVSNYVMARWLGIENSYWAIILPGLAAPLGVFLVRQQMLGLHRSYVESAQIDGASHMRILLSIATPMMQGAIAAMLLLTFIEYWNVVDQAIVFIQRPLSYPLSVYLSRTVTEDIGVFFAVACIYLFPAVLLFLYGQQSMLRGIQLSGLKR